MPQLTLFSDPTSKTISLSPQKAASTSTSTSTFTSPNRHKTYYQHPRGDEPNLRELHHIQEDIAKMHADNVKRDIAGEGGGEAVGQPGKRRLDSPEGGGVAGDTKRSRNAYEISEWCIPS